jgi:hypothetical protein
MASSDPTSGPDGERDVFGSLPNARPRRRSAKRDRPGATAKAASPAAAKAKATAAKPKSAKPTAAKTTAKAKPRTTAKAKPAAKPRVATAAPVSDIPPAGYATPRPDDDGVPRGADLVTTAVQAAGELAQIGLAAGGRALKSALERLPRP